MTTTNKTIDFTNIEACFFDLDGCIYNGETVAEDAVRLLENLAELEWKIGFITNNSCHTAREIAMKLRRMGVHAAPEQVIGVTDLAGEIVKEQYGKVKVKVAGSGPLADSFDAAGHRVFAIESGEVVPDLIMIGRDTAFTYERLLRLANDCAAGAELIGANADRYHPGEGGLLIPETGAIAAAVEAASGRRGMTRYIGKPEPYLFQTALRRFDCVPGRTVMIGDNPLTDVTGASGMGMNTIWLRSAAFGERMPESAATVEPDMIVDSLGEMLAVVR